MKERRIEIRIVSLFNHNNVEHLFDVNDSVKFISIVRQTGRFLFAEKKQNRLLIRDDNYVIFIYFFVV